jgi:opacity protein-like surface antigen
MFKYLLVSFTGFLLIGSFSVYSQRDANVGIFAGTAYYMGDINPNRHFYNPSFSMGAFYRYNINTRVAVRVNGYYASLSGSDLDFPNQLHPDRPVSPALFNTSLLDVGLQVEYNFMPYTPNVADHAYTPYISTGIAGALILSTDVTATNLLSFPFGIGIKMNVSKKITAGAEWSFRKSFNDRIDGLENPSGVHSVIHNNDWYSFIGIFITYKFFNFDADCPAYKKEK